MIKIFTDTSANLPAEIISKYGFGVAPFTYTVGDEVFSEPVDFDGGAFYGAMRRGTKVSTSMVNAFTYNEAFEAAAANGDDVLYIGMSGGISGSFWEAIVALDDLRRRYPKQNFAAVNTLTASLGEGLQVIEAAEMLAAGASFQEIVVAGEVLAGRMRSYFTVDDLSYLVATGRVSRFSARMGTALQIKPILTNNDEGQIIVNKKVRSRKKSLIALADHYFAEVADKGGRVGIAHADCVDDAAFVVERLRAGGFNGELIEVMYEPVTGSHVGPGAVALFFEAGEHR